jgi:hypothetical protein
MASSDCVKYFFIFLSEKIDKALRPGIFSDKAPNLPGSPDTVAQFL